MLPDLRPRLLWAAATLGAALVVVACGSDSDSPELFIGGIPDQDVSILEARFNDLAEYLSEEVGVKVRYIPSQSYAALVTAWANDDIHLAWFGGLTGVQARLAVPGSSAVAQRATDESFQSVFIAAPEAGIGRLSDLHDRTFSFGSESSTSGHLMPRFFLSEEGLEPERDFAGVAYSGSHDTTWKQVESGAVEAGVLNAKVWDTRVREGAVDLRKVEVFFRTSGYADYHWVVRPGLDDVYGKGFTQQVVEGIFKLDAAEGGRDKAIMDAFAAARFVPTTNENYQPIETIARDLKLITEQ